MWSLKMVTFFHFLELLVETIKLKMKQQLKQPQQNQPMLLMHKKQS